MSIEADMRSMVVTDGAVNALISDRFFAVYVPQGQDYPAVVYEQTRGSGERTLGGQWVREEAVFNWQALAATLPEVVQVKSALLNLNGRQYGDVARLEVEEGPQGYDFDGKLFYQVLVARISAGG